MVFISTFGNSYKNENRDYLYKIILRYNAFEHPFHRTYSEKSVKIGT